MFIFDILLGVIALVVILLYAALILFLSCVMLFVLLMVVLGVLWLIWHLVLGLLCAGYRIVLAVKSFYDNFKSCKLR